MPLKGGTRGQVDSIIHNLSYYQSNSTFLTEFGGFRNVEFD